MKILKEGTKLKSLDLPHCPAVVLGPESWHVASLTVSMENGQMSPVPWARAETRNGRVSLYNLALAEAVELAADEETT